MTRLSINVDDVTAEAIKELAERRSVTITETIRRAVSILHYAETEVADTGKELHLVDRSTGEDIRLLIL